MTDVSSEHTLPSMCSPDERQRDQDKLIGSLLRLMLAEKPIGYFGSGDRPGAVEDP
jgi:hypothetical protein